MRRIWLGFLLWGLGVAGCGDNEKLGTGNEAGVIDGAPGDAPAFDGSGEDGAIDAAAVEGGSIDAATIDGQTVDAANPDGGSIDGAPPDAATTDAATPDAGTPDAATPDAALTCSGMPNGTLCPGANDPNNGERCMNNVCVGTYVSTPVSSGGVGADSNPGTRAQPRATVMAGITQAVALRGAGVAGPVTVFIGISGGTNPTVWSENITVPNNIHLSGGWSRDSAAVWTRAIGGNVTRITSSRDLGLLIEGDAVTRASIVVSGLAVQGASINAGDSCAITVRNDADPTLDQLTVVGGMSGTLSAGICVVRGPLGAMTSPLIQGSAVTGGPGPISAAVRTGISLALPEIRMSNLTGGTATQTSIGFFCMTECAGTVIDMSILTGGDAPDAQGAQLTGTTTGIRISASTIVGGGPAVGSLASGLRTGLEIADAVGCGGQPVEVSGSTIVAMNRGMSEIARGIHVERCALNLTTSLVIGVGSSAGAARAGAARGVFCETVLSRCALTQNSQIAGASGSGGNPADVTTSAIAVVLEGGGTLARTPLVISGDCSDNTMGNAVGLRMSGPVRVENNVILGGSCGGSTGLELTPLPAIGPVNAAAEIVNNHIDGRGSAAAGANSRGVLVNGAPGAVGVPSGSFVNNTILAGSAMNRTVFEEAAMTGDPLQLRNNNLFGATTLYRDDGVALTSSTMVNAMTTGPVASGNISSDPMLVNPGVDFHILVTSPNLNGGLSMTPASPALVTAPRADFDGDARPNPMGAMPDIGPDETN